MQGEVVETAVPCALEGDAFLCLLRKATLLSHIHMSVAVDQMHRFTHIHINRHTNTDIQAWRHTHTDSQTDRGMHTCMFSIPGLSTQVQL